MIIEENCVIRKIANTREIEIDDIEIEIYDIEIEIYDIEIHRFFHSQRVNPICSYILLK